MEPYKDQNICELDDNLTMLSWERELSLCSDKMKDYDPTDPFGIIPCSVKDKD
jgi:hypothetical protein